jgi:hypothetical protein
MISLRAINVLSLLHIGLETFMASITEEMLKEDLNWLELFANWNRSGIAVETKLLSNIAF